MSILNVWHSRDRVLMGVDSRLTRPVVGDSGSGERTLGTFDKLRVYSVAGVVYGSTGSARLSAAIGATLGTLPRLADIDDFAIVFESVFSRAWGLFKADVQATPGALLTGSLHCLAGFSNRRQCMRAVMFEMPSPDAPLERVELDGEQIAAPAWRGEHGKYPVMTSVAAMAEVCGEQIRDAEASAGKDAGVGWPCVITELTRDQIVVARVKESGQ